MENFDRENLTNCWKSVKFVNIFPRQKFAPYGMLITQVADAMRDVINLSTPMLQAY